ncbi:MAG: glycoside hydrolase family 99-like domain-containing protein [Lachnospiraceae bacterium]|nr:glycoside hydrolase family 99-like domain-containing protein [Lachnospiraceae bacterium]
MIKIIANYLPQFHETEENNVWWGKGYTDWVAVKNAKTLFKGHSQPKTPQYGYYDLSNAKDILWQSDLAKKYGIYGFGIYHYWFSSNLNLLSKPAEIILNHKEIDIHFMFIWDNGSWKRTWSNISFSNDWAPLFEIKDRTITKMDNPQKGLLAELKYGNEPEWTAHFEYLLPFFKDDRYIKLNNRPVFVIFHQDNKSEVLSNMIQFWDKLSKQNGFDGICIISQKNNEGISISDYEYSYQPIYSGWQKRNFAERLYRKLFHNELTHKYNYDKIWKTIIENEKNNNDPKSLPGAFVNYDDSPRRGKNGKIVVGGTPQKFEHYMKDLLKICYNKEFVFITAWNEWGEGAYLEPDTETELGYLIALKNAIEN